MPKVIWNNQVIAEAPASDVHRVEGNVYFPLSAVKRKYFRPCDTHTSCVWKGIASYHDVVEEKVNDDSIWYYTEPSGMAVCIKDHVAFRHGVKMEE
jgi:uncharacterized protein (DUF427 family)